MNIKQKIFDLVSFPVLLILNRAIRPSVRLVEKLHPIYTVIMGKNIIKYECTSLITLWRAKTLLTKEPDTIEWIDSFGSGDILYDIGANVGMYSIYAASKNIKVIAFEPESQNYAQLNRNIYLNQFQDHIMALNLAVGKNSAIDYLFLSEFTVGGAINNLGSSTDYNHKEMKSVFKQGVMSFSLDNLIEKYNLPVPSHLKIDVDGLESEIICGAKNTLNHAGLKSILIELNENLSEDSGVVEILQKNGFSLKGKYHAPMFDFTEYKDIYNYIFVRSH
ncbi:MAG: FkbM family methyltransferase [Anaerolineaceae bacterium]|nr:FkbM family methyltransferase [Betaproteobacteria bacterium]